VYLFGGRFRVFSKDYGSIQEAKIDLSQQELKRRRTKTGAKVGFYNRYSAFYRTCQTMFFDNFFAERSADNKLG